uniref:BPTI/Kunitz inhibitor domain-containing protein n=1 Tax=Callorhinchus milii TaxID=7868 RepID=A0A4W3J8K4_CALMI
MSSRRESLFLTGFFNFMLHTDPCSQPMDEGSCSLYVLLWYYYPESSECRPFVYSGCGGNNNHFASKQECMDRCVERKEKVIVFFLHLRYTKCKDYYYPCIGTFQKLHNFCLTLFVLYHRTDTC